MLSPAAEKANQGSGEAGPDQPGVEERGDLIQFYNTVFVLKMKSFALRYATHDNRVRAYTHMEMHTHDNMVNTRMDTHVHRHATKG